MNASHLLALDSRAKPVGPPTLKEEIAWDLATALSALDEIVSRLDAKMTEDIAVWEASDDLAAVRKAVKSAAVILELSEIVAGRIEG